MCAEALTVAKRGLFMMKLAALLSYEGYGANQQILSETVNALRKSPGQVEVAAWFLGVLADSKVQPRRIQEALSFRTVPGQSCNFKRWLNAFYSKFSHASLGACA